MEHYRHITPGGCGSTWLGRFMKLKCGLVFPKGWKAHSRNPKKNPAPDCRILYLTSDPFDMILSFERRRFLKEKAHCKHMEGDVKLLTEIINGNGLQSLFQKGKDPFKIEDHFNQWFNYSQRRYDLLIVKYEHLKKHIEDILRFFEVYTEERVDEFCRTYKPRNSDWQKASDDTKRGLEKVYGSYRERWLGLESKIFLPRND